MLKLFYELLKNKQMEISNKQIILKSWELLIKNLSFVMMIFLIVISFHLILSQIQSVFTSTNSINNYIFIIASHLFLQGINLGIIRVSLNIVNGKNRNLADLFSCFNILLSYIMASFIYLLILIIIALPGILLLLLFSGDISNIFDSNSIDLGIVIPITISIIPIIYMSIRLQFYSNILIDEEIGWLDTIKKSYRITNGHATTVLILNMKLLIIILLSAIPMFIGLIISLPLASIANVCIYNLLNKSNTN